MARVMAATFSRRFRAGGVLGSIRMAIENEPGARYSTTPVRQAGAHSVGGDMSAADPARTLIVVPCLNEAAHLPALLEQLVAENRASTIVVVDGGSDDCSTGIVADFARRSPMVHLLNNPRRIQSVAINLAVATFGAGHDWLVRVDAHCNYPADYVARLLGAARRRAATTVVVPMLTRGQGCFQAAAAAAQNSVIGTGGSAHRMAGEGRFVEHGHHALFSLADFIAVGGYDESFTHNEDAELDARLTANGARIWLEPEATIIYTPRGSPEALFRQYRNYGKGRARMLAKHRLPLKPRQRLPLLVAPAVGLAGLGLGLTCLAAGFAVLVLPALTWVVLGLGAGVWLGIRQGSRCAALAGVAALIMHFGWSLGYWQARRLGQSRTNGETTIPK